MSDVSPSLRDALDASWEEAAGGAGLDDAGGAAASGQARDEAGRYAAKAEGGEGASAAEADDYDEGLGLDRDTWKQTPATARERARALAAEAKQAREALAPFDAVLADRREALRANFGDEATALKQLFHLSDWAGRDFPGFVRHLAEQRGVDLRSLLPAAAPAGQAPAGQAAAAPVQDMRAAIRQEAEAMLIERDTDRALSDFEGNAAYEFRTDPAIRRTMAGLLTAGAASDLPTAYDLAVKAHPTTAAKLAERASAAAAANRGEGDAARRAAASRSAAASVRGAPGTAQPSAAAVPETVGDALRAAWDAGGGRV